MKKRMELKKSVQRILVRHSPNLVKDVHKLKKLREHQVGQTNTQIYNKP